MGFSTTKPASLAVFLIIHIDHWPTKQFTFTILYALLCLLNYVSWNSTTSQFRDWILPSTWWIPHFFIIHIVANWALLQDSHSIPWKPKMGISYALTASALTILRMQCLVWIFPALTMQQFWLQLSDLGTYSKLNKTSQPIHFACHKWPHHAMTAKYIKKHKAILVTFLVNQ